MNTVPFKNLFFSRTNDFLNVYLAKQISRSNATISSYRKALLLFFRYITEIRHLNPSRFQFIDCTHAFMLEYSDYLQNVRKYKPASVNQRLAAIKSYVRYAADDNFDITQVWLNVMNVPLLKVPHHQRPIVENDALADMLDIPGTSKFAVRDRTVLIFMFDTAVRVAELVSITIGDLHLDIANPYVCIHGKGNKDRVVGISDKTKTHLDYYMDRFHTDIKDMDTPLFYTIIRGHLGQMSIRNVERIVEKYANVARIKHIDMPDTVYPHMLRRTRATDLYRDGVPLEMVSRILGHRFLDTTKIYASPSVEQLREKMNRGKEHEPEEPLWKGNEDELARRFGLK